MVHSYYLLNYSITSAVDSGQRNHPGMAKDMKNKRSIRLVVSPCMTLPGYSCTRKKLCALGYHGFKGDSKAEISTCRKKNVNSRRFDMIW